MPRLDVLDTRGRKQLAALSAGLVRQETDRLQEAGKIDERGESVCEESASWPSRICPHAARDRPKWRGCCPNSRRRGTQKGRILGLLGPLGLNRWLLPIDDATRTPFTPYGLSGIMLGAAIVFFAYIGFDRSRPTPKRPGTRNATCPSAS